MWCMCFFQVLIYIHIVYIVIYKRVDHITCMRDLLVFSDTINCKSRKRKLVSCEIAAEPPCFVVLQASMFHPLMMGFSVKFVGKKQLIQF